MISILALDHDTLMRLGPGAAISLLIITAFAVYVNIKDRGKD